MRKLPPVGTRLQWHELAAALRDAEQGEARLEAALAARIPCARVFLFGSGRAALAALLTALKKLRAGDRVIVPAYTCWSVPAAVVRAGLRVLPVDVLPTTIDYDYDQLSRLDWRGVLAIVSPNLFGLPGELNHLAELAEDHDAVLIDDAAQCLGGQADGRPVGSHGVAGIVSFGRGKNVTALGGGAALVHDEDLAAAMAAQGDVLRDGPPPTGLDVALKGGAMRFALEPSLYGFAEMAPGVTVGRTVYEPNFPATAMGGARAAVAVAVLRRLDEINHQRANLAAWIDQFLKPLRGLVLVKPGVGNVPAWLRRPLLTQEVGKRDALLAGLQSVGIGASAMYPAPVHAIEELAPDLDLRAAPFAGAQRLADSLIVLPLVEGILQQDLEKLGVVVTEVMGRRLGERWV
ncbi:MAG: DegT/DnrJ/EryC1/StrS aminotransferase family protein [Myxococcales bacterium]|nr:DegT/DnrJ/EryC1/StrS aminotransferase family protein [Myxococcales bacterium]